MMTSSKNGILIRNGLNKDLMNISVAPVAWLMSEYRLKIYGDKCEIMPETLSTLYSQL
ncbi:hypothetical protein [Calothrix sp. NIES-2100]|uniref:hypothetical protein n=1 Tax=Calothrix sp. NIES-2100 TaxID=1954172 RepID=UPI0030D9B334